MFRAVNESGEGLEAGYLSLFLPEPLKEKGASLVQMGVRLANGLDDAVALLALVTRGIHGEALIEPATVHPTLDVVVQAVSLEKRGIAPPRDLPG